MSKVKGHPSDEFQQYTFEFDGSVLVTTTERESVVVTIRLSTGMDGREGLIEELRAMTDELWSEMPAPRLSAMARATPPTDTCRECKEILARHVSRGTRTLECPNRCPSCNDEAVVRGLSVIGDPVWTAVGWGESGQEIDFCPFCGLDLRGEWKIGL